MKQLLVFGCLCAVLFVTGVTQASALTISPVRIEVQGDPGQTLRGEMEMLNEQLEPKKFFSSFENFEPSGDTGSPHFIGNKDGLATWLQTEASVDFAPNDKKVIPYTITIPKDAEPGGYFSAIFWGGQDPSVLEAGEVSIGGKLGVLILLRVNGDIDEQAGLSEFGTVDAKRFFDTLPISFIYRFTNDGGDRVVPLGDIVVKNMFGGVTKNLLANEQEGNVLPSSSRRFTSVWTAGEVSEEKLSFSGAVKRQITNFHLGLYSANIHVVYGAQNQSAEDVFYFVIVPWQLLVVVFALLVLLIVALKRYNAWIVARSRAQ
jgi:hypothetical protein